MPDAQSKTVRRRVTRQVAALDRSRELEALKWIEAVTVLLALVSQKHREPRRRPRLSSSVAIAVTRLRVACGQSAMLPREDYQA